MRNDADFAAYMAARWPSVVRSLVLLGCPRQESEHLARTGLARCYASWDRVRKADDVDAHVYRTVLDCWHRSRRQPWWHRAAEEPESPDDPVEDTVDEPSEQVLLCRALEAQLGGLSAVHREVLVLRFVAELTDPQVAEVLDEPLGTVRSRVSQALANLDLVALRDDRPMTERLALEIFRTAGESIDVLAPPVDPAIAEARALRRHRRRVATGSVAAAVVVIAGLTWAGTRPQDEEPPKPDAAKVVESRNPADIAWYAAGTLHLDDVAVEVPALTDLVEVAGGVVYGDLEGTVAFVAADGTRSVIGEKLAAAPLVGSEDDRWAAWVDPSGDQPALVVYDLAVGEVLDRLQLASPGMRSHPVAIDQGRVFYTTGQADFSWSPFDEEPTRLGRQGLLDAAAATEVYELDRRIEMVQGIFGVTFVRPGAGAILSGGGNAVLTRAPGSWAPGDPFRPLLYDTRDGDPVASGVGPDEIVVDAAFGAEHDVVYLVGRAADFGGGADLDGASDPLLTLRSCQLGTAACHDVTLLPRAGERPLLAD